MKKILAALVVIATIVTCAFTFAACNSKVDYKIGVQSGTTGEFYVKGNADMLYDGFSNVECKGFDNAGLAVKAMLDGQVDYVIIDNEVGKALVAQNSGIKQINIALTTEQYAYGVDKNQPELLAKINAFIAKIKNDGSLDELFNKYSSLEYDDAGNVIGGDEAIVGVESATYNSTKSQFVVATNAAFAPYEYKKGDKFAGIDMEIAKLMADEFGMELVIVDGSFDAVVTSVGKNGVDVAMAGLSVTATRKEVVNFSDPYYEGASQMLLVKADDTKFDACTTKAEVEALLKTK